MCFYVTPRFVTSNNAFHKHWVRMDSFYNVLSESYAIEVLEKIIDVFWYYLSGKLDSGKILNVLSRGYL